MCAMFASSETLQFLLSRVGVVAFVYRIGYSVAYCQECASYSGFFSLSSSWLFSNITSIVSQPRVEMGFVNCPQATYETHSTWSRLALATAPAPAARSPRR